MTQLSERRQSQIATDLTFNFALALPGRASSMHTQRAYFRWVDTYLVDMAGFQATQGPKRIARMHALPVQVLQEVLTAQQLRAWLGILIGRKHGKQGVDQARAAVVTLADLLAEAGWLDDYAAAAMSRVRPPRAEDGQRPGRWLSVEQIRLLMDAAQAIATSENQMLRNEVVIKMLCTMALRREELSVAQWGDLSLQDERITLRVHGKGRKVAFIDVPPPVFKVLNRWRRLVAPGELHPHAATPLVRRLWKGGRIARQGLSPDGIWMIVDQSAAFAGLGHVAPHDLRRSVAGALHQSGVAVEQISRLLRHSNITVTERYLNRLPQANTGAILMSQTLGLDDEIPGKDFFHHDE